MAIGCRKKGSETIVVSKATSHKSKFGVTGVTFKRNPSEKYNNPGNKITNIVKMKEITVPGHVELLIGPTQRKKFNGQAKILAEGGKVVCYPLRSSACATQRALYKLIATLELA
uniref:Uncharacterized protein n=1 Tax=Oryza punctata TaxID=4537 RepID=A0A0E0LHY0_ORYPU